MNHSVNRSVNRARSQSCPIHWGKGREWKGMEWRGSSPDPSSSSPDVSRGSGR